MGKPKNMTKEAFQIEYVLRKGSANLLWKLISTPSGLAEWFADDVDQRDELFTFYWDKSSQEAERISQCQGKYMRFHWVDEPDNYYFEMRIEQSDLTGDTVLRITDFAEPSELSSNTELWNTQIEILTRRTGL